MESLALKFYPNQHLAGSKALLITNPLGLRADIFPDAP
jgi:hypothetical protein